MRSSRQSGQGWYFRTNSKNQAPHSVAKPTTKTASAAAAAGSSESRSIQLCFIVVVPVKPYAEAAENRSAAQGQSQFAVAAGSNVPILRAEARPGKLKQAPAHA